MNLRISIRSIGAIRPRMSSRSRKVLNSLLPHGNCHCYELSALLL